MSDNIHPVDKHVGERVRMARKIRGLSQTALGDALGLTFQQIQKYEKGINRVSASRLFEMSEALGVEISYFFEGQPDRDTIRTRNTADASLPLTGDETRLLTALRSSNDPTLRKTLLGLVEAVKVEKR